MNIIITKFGPQLNLNYSKKRFWQWVCCQFDDEFRYRYLYFKTFFLFLHSLDFILFLLFQLSYICPESITDRRELKCKSINLRWQLIRFLSGLNVNWHFITLVIPHMGCLEENPNILVLWEFFILASRIESLFQDSLSGTNVDTRIFKYFSAETEMEPNCDNWLQKIRLLFKKEIQQYSSDWCMMIYN